MSKIKNDGLDQHGAEPFEQQQFGTAGIEGVKAWCHHVVRLQMFSATFSISDIRALWHSALSARVPECQKLKM